MLHIANVRKILILILFLSVFLPLSLPILMSYPMCLEYNHDKNKQNGQQRLSDTDNYARIMTTPPFGSYRASLS